MAISDAGKVCLFSKVSGVILLDGKPAANALVVRRANLTKELKDETRTDENGYFEMPAVFTRTVTKFLPQEFAPKQNIDVTYNGIDYSIWSAVKSGPEENTESKGKPLEVTCELNSENTTIVVNGAFIYSRCTWDVEPDPKMEF